MNENPSFCCQILFTNRTIVVKWWQDHPEQGKHTTYRRYFAMNRGSYRNGLARNRHSMGEPGRNRAFFHTLLTLALAIALVVVLITSAPNQRFRNDYRNITIERMQNKESF